MTPNCAFWCPFAPFGALKSHICRPFVQGGAKPAPLGTKSRGRAFSIPSLGPKGASRLRPSIQGRPSRLTERADAQRLPGSRIRQCVLNRSAREAAGMALMAPFGFLLEALWSDEPRKTLFTYPKTRETGSVVRKNQRPCPFTPPGKTPGQGVEGICPAGRI
jgi:hypothetical protein